MEIEELEYELLRAVSAQSRSATGESPNLGWVTATLGGPNNTEVRAAAQLLADKGFLVIVDGDSENPKYELTTKAMGYLATCPHAYKSMGCCRLVRT